MARSVVLAVVVVAVTLPLAALARQKPPVKEPPPASAAPSANETADRVQKFYETTRDLHARFEQVLDSGSGGHKKASGDLWLKKPGRMRWDYVKPERKLMIADGTTLWVYEPEDQQAFRQDMRSASLPSSVSLLMGDGKGKLADEFTITVEKVAGVGADGDVVLKLVPKQATAQYRYVVFAVDGKTAMVKELMIYDQQGGANHLTFRDVETNRGVSDGKFAFTPPVGTKIIRP